MPSDHSANTGIKVRRKFSYCQIFHHQKLRFKQTWLSHSMGSGVCVLRSGGRGRALPSTGWLCLNSVSAPRRPRRAARQPASRAAAGGDCACASEVGVGGGGVCPVNVPLRLRGGAGPRWGEAPRHRASARRTPGARLKGAGGARPPLPPPAPRRRAAAAGGAGWRAGAAP